ncbi:MAG: GH32 C-terminal domain-containing protein, partial [Bryobacteraceae bacterium]
NDETLVGYDALKQELFVDRSHCANAHFSKAFPSRTTAPLKIGNGPLRLHIFVDRSSIEVFAQGGRIAMTNLTFPAPSSTGLSLGSSGEIGSIHLKIWKLHSIWK